MQIYEACNTLTLYTGDSYTSILAKIIICTKDTFTTDTHMYHVHNKHILVSYSQCTHTFIIFPIGTYMYHIYNIQTLVSYSKKGTHLYHYSQYTHT